MNTANCYLYPNVAPSSLRVILYATDAWEIFQNNNKNVNPTDKVLLAYLDMEM